MDDSFAAQTSVTTSLGCLHFPVRLRLPPIMLATPMRELLILAIRGPEILIVVLMVV
jgi:hypothetical protein